MIERLIIAWIRIKVALKREPYGIPRKGIVYLNKKAQKAFREAE